MGPMNDFTFPWLKKIQAKSIYAAPIKRFSVVRVTFMALDNGKFIINNPDTSNYKNLAVTLTDIPTGGDGLITFGHPVPVRYKVSEDTGQQLWYYDQADPDSILRPFPTTWSGVYPRYRKIGMVNDVGYSYMETDIAFFLNEIAQHNPLTVPPSTY